MTFNKLVRLRVQITANELTIIAEPHKGDSDEEEALRAINYLVQMLRHNGVALKTFERNTPTGNRVDMVAVRLRG